MPHKTAEERAAYHKAYRERNKEKLKALNAAYRAENADKIKERKREEYLENRESYINRTRKYYSENGDRIRAYRKTPEYREKVNAQRRASYVPHPLPPPMTREEQLQKKRDDYKKNRERYKAAHSAYYQQNKEKFLEYSRKVPFWMKKFKRGISKAVLKGAVIVDIESIREFYRQVYTSESGVCIYCRGEFPSKEIVIDHMKPFKLKGNHEVSNLAISCSLCNLKKGSKPFDVWTSLGMKGGS